MIVFLFFLVGELPDPWRSNSSRLKSDGFTTENKTKQNIFYIRVRRVFYKYFLCFYFFVVGVHVPGRSSRNCLLDISHVFKHNVHK